MFTRSTYTNVHDETIRNLLALRPTQADSFRTPVMMVASSPPPPAPPAPPQPEDRRALLIELLSAEYKTLSAAQQRSVSLGDYLESGLITAAGGSRGWQH